MLRVYLAPEDTAVRARRLKGGGNTKRSFTEGWVEFADKRRAKRIASSLNNTPMGGGHRSFYAHDLWNIKYLHKFKWHHLTEKIAADNRTRNKAAMRAEIARAKKESTFYLKRVRQAKAIDAMEARKARKAAAAADRRRAATARAVAAPPTARRARLRRSESARRRPKAAAAAAARGNAAAASDAAELANACGVRFRQRRVAPDGAAAGGGGGGEEAEPTSSLLGAVLPSRQQ